ncbi:hypothetical protein [Aminivibrio sp.]|uniref:hypothetical protein n=1 Tax=Aminivibrio sp. TaxID=1872489 RepID=UPI00345E4F49
MLAGVLPRGAGICRLGSGYYTVLLFAGGKGSGIAGTERHGVDELEKSLQEFEEASAARRSVLGTKEPRGEQKAGNDHGAGVEKWGAERRVAYCEGPEGEIWDEKIQ